MKKIPSKSKVPKLFWLSRDQYEKMIEWMNGLPDCVDDSSVNASARWTYMLTDHGLWTHKVVRDNFTEQEHEIQDDYDNW